MTRNPLEAAAGFVAVAGGTLSLAAAAIVCASVTGRWLFGQPVPGDFELVKMATAVSVFAFLPFTQVRRGNIVVDTFTARLAPRSRDIIDALWDLAYAAVMGLTAWQLVTGTAEAMRSGETTMEMQLPLWPAIGLGMVLCWMLALCAAAGGLRLLAGRR